MNKFEKALLDFDQHCSNIRSRTQINADEPTKERLKRIERARKDYAFFVEFYFPHYAKYKCAKFHLDVANKIKESQSIRAVIEWARGHAKSTHAGIFIPMWLKIQKNREFNVMVLVSKSEDMADKLLSDIQAELQSNQRYIHDFGEQVQFGSWAEGEFMTRDGCGFFSRGKGQSPRGMRAREWRPDYVVIDDLDDDEEVQNPKRIQKSLDWVLEALFGALDMGRGRFIMVGNRIHKKSVLALMAERPGVHHTVINALDKDGHPSWKEKYTKEEIESACAFMGYRRSQKEYFNNPITEGTVFKEEFIKWKKMLPLNNYDALIAYCDPSFKGTSKNDYKAIRLWGKAGNELHLIDCFVRQASVSAMVKWFYDLHESLPEDVIVDYIMEANFIQDMLLEEFTTEGDERGYQLPIRGDYRKKPDKFQRIEALSPLYERGFVYYNIDRKDDPDMMTGKEQLLAIEKGSTTADDAPDADEGAIWHLQRVARAQKFKGSLGKVKHKRIY